MKSFIFKSNDEELALVDLHAVIGVELCNHQECITIRFDSVTDKMSVLIENAKDRSSEFLRLTTAIQSMQDEDMAEGAIFMQVMGNQSH